MSYFAVVIMGNEKQSFFNGGLGERVTSLHVVKARGEDEALGCAIKEFRKANKSKPITDTLIAEVPNE